MKQQEIVKMFDDIAPTYDFVNKLVSFGIDKKWREEGIKKVFDFITPKKVLDVACGTGDMIEIWKTYGVDICGIDPSKGMLEVARKRFNDVKFYQSYATQMPIENHCADSISISFGIRNVLDIQKAINEFYRVLNDNGIVLIIEFVKPQKSTVFRKAVDFYSNKILPKIGGFVSKNKQAYQYLPASIQHFYTLEELTSLFEKNNFILKYKKTYNFGQVAIIILQKR